MSAGSTASANRNLHCYGEDVTGCADGHAGAKDHLLATSVQNAVVRVPGRRQCESDVHLFMSFPAYKHNHTRRHWSITPHRPNMPNTVVVFGRKTLCRNDSQRTDPSSMKVILVQTSHTHTPGITD